LEQRVVSVVLSCAPNQFLALPVRQATDFVPIFISDIVVDFYCARVETVAAPLLAARNPIVFPGLSTDGCVSWPC
jgi:hypothetical protein